MKAILQTMIFAFSLVVSMAVRADTFKGTIEAVVSEASCIKVAQDTSVVGGAVGGTAGAIGGAVVGDMLFGKTGGWLGGLVGGAAGGAIGSQGDSTYSCKVLAKVPDYEDLVLVEGITKSELRPGQRIKILKKGDTWALF